MSQLFETIKLIDGKPVNLGYHQRRLDDALINYFRSSKSHNLSENLNVPAPFRKGTSKWRFVYDDQGSESTFEKYNQKKITGFKLVNVDFFDYQYKYYNRSTINRLIEEYGAKGKDIIIAVNGVITDASYSNLVFKKEDLMFTPANCLLRGTKRQYYLDKERIWEAQIKIDDLPNFQMVTRINAMMDLGDDSWITVGKINH
jgi:4-amino-4-deoxychorismate lyase